MNLQIFMFPKSESVREELCRRNLVDLESDESMMLTELSSPDDDYDGYLQA